MAFGGLGSLDVDMCIAITGYAGDTGGSEKSPRGTIHICTAKRLRNVTSFNYKMINVNESRGKNIEKCLEAALETALEHLRKNDELWHVIHGLIIKFHV
jgi:nicotinamide mononucleotide (NMN) deamidase PncC